MVNWGRGGNKSRTIGQTQAPRAYQRRNVIEDVAARLSRLSLKTNAQPNAQAETGRLQVAAQAPPAQLSSTTWHLGG
jgi:hypothetical protein